MIDAIKGFAKFSTFCGGQGADDNMCVGCDTLKIGKKIKKSEGEMRGWKTFFPYAKHFMSRFSLLGTDVLFTSIKFIRFL